jgi:hypothetical protein
MRNSIISSWRIPVNAFSDCYGSSFEGYLDTNEHKYNYPPMETMTLNSLTFLHDADVLNIDDDYKERPTSDSAHVVDFLKEKGLHLRRRHNVQAHGLAGCGSAQRN